ncbi:hypothetical protein [Paraburkholderia sp. DGU8]|uniref:hypothetical protein n=1 Tax=Paraburkholderia sp. DGU8 TaxID=3161997 RepID=UPI0034657291
MSYSIYLLHGLVITIFITRPGVMPYALESNEKSWMVTATVFAIIIATSIVSFAVIERGGIRLGRLCLKLIDEHGWTGQRCTLKS